MELCVIVRPLILPVAESNSPPRQMSSRQSDGLVNMDSVLTSTFIPSLAHRTGGITPDSMEVLSVSTG